VAGEWRRLHSEELHILEYSSYVFKSDDIKDREIVTACSIQREH
jgi:hypothetical protein